MFKKQKAPLIIALLGCLMLVVAFVVTQIVTLRSPAKVFWSALDNSLTTRSLTREIKGGAYDGENSYMIMQTQLGERGLVHIVEQQDMGQDLIASEYAIAPDEAQVRLTDLMVDQEIDDKTRAGVIGVWAKLPTDEQSDPSQYFLFSSQPVLPFFPVADLATQDRQRLIDYAKDHAVFTANNTASKVIDGRLTNSYEVGINWQEYHGFYELFLKALGFNDNQSSNMASMLATSQSEDNKYQVTIDVYSRQVLEVENKNSSAKEIYSGYGLVSSFGSMPQANIDLSELSRRLDSIISR